VWVGATLERLDLERGTRTGVGDETPVPIRAIVDDPCGEGLFVGQGGTVTLWEASLTARLRHFPHLPGFRMVTTDGALLLAVEEGTVVAVARDGTPRWKTTMAIPQTEDGRSWMLEGLEIVEDDAKVVVVRLTFFALREDDGVVEAVASTCVERLLHRLDGAVIAERAGPLAQKSSTGGAWVVSNRGDVLVDGYKVPMGVGLGQITAARLSKDQRSLHVGTSLGQLMHLSRPSRGVASTVR
jgi:hypothetical protein